MFFTRAPLATVAASVLAQQRQVFDYFMLSTLGAFPDIVINGAYPLFRTLPRIEVTIIQHF